MLDTSWFEDLIAIAETRNMTRAAELRNITQSGLSRRIKSLENWAGAPLIDRRRTPLDLTKAGYKLLEVADEILGRLNSARRSIREDQNGRIRSIRFAAPHILSATFFPRWLSTIQMKPGSARISIASDNLPNCVSLLEEGSVDFVVCLIDADGAIFNRAGTPLAIKNCNWMSVGQERLVPLSAPAADGISPLHCLENAVGHSIPYLAYSSECSLGWAVEGLIARRRDLGQFRSLYENSLADGLRAMALAGLGVAWLPLSITHSDILRSKLVRAGHASLAIDLDIRLYRIKRRLPNKAEEFWARLAAGPAEVSSLTAPPYSSETASQLQNGTFANMTNRRL